MTLSFATLRHANTLRLPQFKNSRGEPAHNTPDGSDWSLNDWMTAILGELGEAANLVKKIRRGDMALTAARDELGREFADVVIYTDLLAFRLDKPLGIPTGSNTFNQLRSISSSPSIIHQDEISDCMVASLGGYGRASEQLPVPGMITSSVAPQIVMAGLRYGLLAIDRAAFKASIDLEAAVRDKFNEVSRRVKVPVYINEDDTVIDQDGSII